MASWFTSRRRPVSVTAAHARSMVPPGTGTESDWVDTSGTPLSSRSNQRGPASGRVGNAVDGWPTRSGLGGRRPIVTSAQKANDLAELTEWAKTTIPDEFATEPSAAYHLGLLIGLLSREIDNGVPDHELPLPACLQGPRS